MRRPCSTEHDRQGAYGSQTQSTLTRVTGLARGWARRLEALLRSHEGSSRVAPVGDHILRALSFGPSSSIAARSPSPLLSPASAALAVQLLYWASLLVASTKEHRLATFGAIPLGLGAQAVLMNAAVRAYVAHGPHAGGAHALLLVHQLAISVASSLVCAALSLLSADVAQRVYGQHVHV